MHAHERHREILKRLTVHPRVEVKELAADFGVTEETTRRDLDKLAADGLVARVHGGAVAKRHSVTELDLSTRLTTNLEAKALIASAAEPFIPATGNSVLVDAGSTAAALAPALAAARITLLTHSPGIALDLAAAGATDVHVLPGKLRPATRAAVGAPALAAISALSASVAFLGCNGLTANGFGTPDPDEAAVKTALTEHAALRVMLADSSKIGATSLVTFANWEAIDVLVTDTPLPPDFTRIARETHTEVVTP